uniref:Protein tweety homolog n=1 Tax=Meloidogyne hapla TaxID=6305 RepID=A0A1I8BSZ1_MELHA
MFYACLSILLLLLISMACVCLSIIDLETYNFGLYIVLLCIVGTMLACALCVANPNACPNPGWYSNFCLMLQEMYPSPEDSVKAAIASPEMNGLRSRMMAHYGVNVNQMGDQQQQPTSSSGEGGRLTLRYLESNKLAPAVHIMHQVWRGMAWVAEGMDDEEDLTKSYDQIEQGTSHSASQECTDSSQKRLSTIAESSSGGIIEQNQEESGEFASGQDVIV